MDTPYTDLRTAEDIAAEREILLLWGANAEEREAAGDPRWCDPHGEFYEWRGQQDLMAEQITARAVALGLETAAGEEP